MRAQRKRSAPIHPAQAAGAESMGLRCIGSRRRTSPRLIVADRSDTAGHGSSHSAAAAGRPTRAPQAPAGAQPSRYSRAHRASTASPPVCRPVSGAVQTSVLSL